MTAGRRDRRPVWPVQEEGRMLVPPMGRQWRACQAKASGLEAVRSIAGSVFE